MDHALDAVFAWLDGESLLRAGMVCRRWAHRAVGKEAWHGRVAGVRWARDLSPRDAYRRSLSVRSHWLRRVAVTTLETGLRPLCSDGDWLVYAHDRSHPDDPSHCRYSGGPVPREYYRSTRLYDADLARTVAVLPDDARAAALWRQTARCATVTTEGPGPGMPYYTYSATCTVWAPAVPPDDRGREAWCKLCSFRLGETTPGTAVVRWQHAHHRLLVYRATNSCCCVEWFDVGAGTARPAARQERAWSSSVQLVAAADASSAFLAVDNALYALDPRASADPGASPLLTFDAADHRSVADLGDGRHVVTGHRAEKTGHRGSWCLELWDLRAAGARAAPVATLYPPSRHRPSWQDVPMCATARGTVLGLTHRECPQRAYCSAHVAIEEWDPARGSTRKLFVAGDDCDFGHYTWRWADERRIIMGHNYLPGVLLDADPGAVRPQGGGSGDDHDA